MLTLSTFQFGRTMRFRLKRRLVNLEAASVIHAPNPAPPGCLMVSSAPQMTTALRTPSARTSLLYSVVAVWAPVNRRRALGSLVITTTIAFLVNVTIRSAHWDKLESVSSAGTTGTVQALRADGEVHSFVMAMLARPSLLMASEVIMMVDVVKVVLQFVALVVRTLKISHALRIGTAIMVTAHPIGGKVSGVAMAGASIDCSNLIQ